MKTHTSTWHSILSQLSFFRNADYRLNSETERWRRVDRGLRIDFYPDDTILYVFSANSRVAETYNCENPDELLSLLHRLDIH